MMSAVIQIVIALTVMMPPGSYRTLQLLTRQTKAASSAIELSNSSDTCPGPVVRSDLQPLRKQIPLRARDWSQVTFTHEEQWDSQSPSAAHSASFQFLAAGDAQISAAAGCRHASAASFTHGSPRAALLALHRLLT